MDNIEIFFYVIVASFLVVVGYLFKAFLLIYKKNFLDQHIKLKKKRAEDKFDKIIHDAKKKAEDIILESQNKIARKEDELEKERERLSKKDEYLDERQSYFNKREEEFDESKKNLVKREREYDKKNENLKQELENISGVGSEEALKFLVEKIKKENNEDLFIAMHKMKNFRLSEINKKAKEMIALAIQKYPKNSNDSKLSTSTIKIENEEIKGKIIGKDGRNIRSFERKTGVQLLIDKTPNIITISSFDPIRREISKIALKRLIDNQIVHPAKIEESVVLAKEEVEETIKEKGSQAAMDLGIYDLPDGLLNILGRLHYRTSYGQNVLSHSMEVAYIAKTLAEELGANIEVVKMAGLFHDIGKAVDANIQGSHVEIGRRILKEYNINEEVIKAMQTHHQEYPNENLESYLIDTADSISGSRKGARNDNANMYIQKLEGLERITKEFDGVLESYALSAGREIRVFVKPDVVNDLEASELARKIALRVEEELKYPGEIKIAIIRETKIVDYAR